MGRYVIPRTPANEGDMLLPMRDAARLMATVIGEAGKVPLVGERDRSVPEDGKVRELERKVDDLVACLNKLTRAVSGR